MNDERQETPHAAGAEHYWSMEHHSYLPPVSAHPPAPPATSRVAQTTGRGRSRRLVASTVLGVALAAGVGSFALAQASDDPDPGQGVATAQTVQADRGDVGPDAGPGRGGRPGGGFGRPR